MKKPWTLLTATGVAVAVCSMVIGNTVGASPPAGDIAGVAAPNRGDDHPHDGNDCNGPWFNVYPNGPALKNDGNNITIPKGAPVSINVIPHCVDASMTIWALHHGWSGDPNLYIFPDSNGTYGPVSWGNHPFTYSGVPGGFQGNGDQQYTITFVAATRECDAQLRAIPHDGGPAPYGPNGAYPGPGGPDGDGPGGPGVPPPPPNQFGEGYYGNPPNGDDPGPNNPPPGDGYVGPGPFPNGPADGNGRYGFQSIPKCCKPMGDVNLNLVEHWNH